MSYKKIAIFLFLHLTIFLPTHSVYQNTNGNRLMSKAEIKISGQVVDLSGLTTIKKEEELNIELEEGNINSQQNIVLVFNHPDIELTYDENELVNLDIKKVLDKTQLETFILKISSSSLTNNMLGKLKSENQITVDTQQGEERLKLIKMTAIYR